MQKSIGRIRKLEKNGQSFPTHNAREHVLKVEVTNRITGHSLKCE